LHLKKEDLVCLIFYI